MVNWAIRNYQLVGNIHFVSCPFLFQEEHSQIV